MGSVRWPQWANRNSVKRTVNRNSTGKLPRRTARPQVEKLEDRLALAPVITPHYQIPNFGDYATIQSDSSGAWSNPDTWSAGRVPTANDVVVISAGTSVTFDLASSAALDSVVIYAGGLLNFRTDISTQMLVTNLQVLEGGELRVGTAANPIAADVTAQIVIRNVALDTVRDPSQFGNGLIGLGKITMHGANRVGYVRLAAEPRAGQTTLTLEAPATGWRVGDKLVLPDSRQISPTQLEQLTISSISSDGKTITLAAPLQFDHPGARDGDGELEFLPHVANRTRNVVVRSESATGTRGHVLFTGRADVDVRYTAFAGTGRTKLGVLNASNPADRHPVTFAHLYGPVGGQANGHAYTFVGNAVFCPLTTHEIKWGIAIRDSHYGLIQDNVLYNWAGSGLATVTGNESFNVIDGNIALLTRGKGDREGWRFDLPGTPKLSGDEGMGFWFAGANNYVSDNVAANAASLTNGEAAYGFKYYMLLGEARIPSFLGADTSVAGQYTSHDIRGLPILEFARNEVYGMENALTIWYINNNIGDSAAPSIVKDFRSWHITAYGYYGYPTFNLTFDGWVQRGDKSILSNINKQPVGIWFGDYRVGQSLTMRNMDIQGVRYGVIDPYFGGTNTIIENSYFRNTYNIVVESLRAPGSGGDPVERQPKRMTIRNVIFGNASTWDNGTTPVNIRLWYIIGEGKVNLIAKDEVFVENYNGTGINYQVFYQQQAANFIMPQSTGPSGILGSPVAGLTNQQNWDQFGIAIAGAVAPANATTVAGIEGLVTTYTVTPDTTAPSTPTGLVATAVSSSRINLAWAASSDNVSVAGYRIYRNGVQIGIASGTSYASTGLAPATTYTYTVVAYDAAGNVSAASAAASATTHSAPSPDTTAPSTPTGLTATAASSSQINLAWAASTDNVQVTGYRIFRNGVQIGTSSTTSYAATGLNAGTTYSFTVRAYDAAGNVSAASSAASATTFAAPPTSSSIVDNGAGGSKLTMGWTRATGSGYEGDLHTALKGTGGKQATWTFTGLAKGQYNVWVTYTASGKNATNAPFSIQTGRGSTPVVKVNQRFAPTQIAAGAKWRFLTKVNVVNGWALVRLTNNANGNVVADAVRLVKLPAAAPLPASAALPASVPLATSVANAKPQLSARTFLAFASGANPQGPSTSSATQTAPQVESPAPGAAHDQVFGGDSDVGPESVLLEDAVSLLSEIHGSASKDGSSSLAIDQLLASSAM